MLCRLADVACLRVSYLGVDREIQQTSRARRGGYEPRNSPARTVDDHREEEYAAGGFEQSVDTGVERGVGDTNAREERRGVVV